MRSLKKTEQKFLLALFSNLKENGVEVLCLRNYEDLPRYMGNDLDIFVRRGNFSQAECLLLKTLADSGGRLIKKYRKDTFAAYWMVIEGGGPIHIDLFNGAFYWRGRRLVESKEILKRSVISENGFPVPRPAHQAFSMFVTPLVWGGFCKTVYNEKVVELLSNSDEMRVFKELYTYNFGVIDWIFNDFIEEKGVLAKCVSVTMREKLRWRFIKKINLLEALKIGRYWFWEVINLVKPAGNWKLNLEGDPKTGCSVIDSEIYGNKRYLEWKGGGLLSWLWFQNRYVRRYMAKNELVLVNSKCCPNRLFIRLAPRFIEQERSRLISQTKCN